MLSVAALRAQNDWLDLERDTSPIAMHEQPRRSENRVIISVITVA